MGDTYSFTVENLSLGTPGVVLASGAAISTDVANLDWSVYDSLFMRGRNVYFDSISISPSMDVGEVIVDENGSNTFDIELVAEPNENELPLTVTFTCSDPNVINSNSPDYALGVTPLSVTFTESDPVGTVKTITVSGVDNALLDGDRGYRLLFSPYNSIADFVYPQAVDVTIVDDESLRLELTDADDLAVAEGGAGGNPETDNFTISISETPFEGEDVIVTMGFDENYLLVSPNPVVFTSDDPSDKIITVTAVDNDENNTEAVPYESLHQEYFVRGRERTRTG